MLTSNERQEYIEQIKKLPSELEEVVDFQLKVYVEHGVKHIGHINGLLDNNGWK